MIAILICFVFGHDLLWSEQNDGTKKKRTIMNPANHRSILREDTEAL